MNATEKRHRMAREEYAKLRWGEFWEDCLSAYEYELTQNVGSVKAENEADNYYSTLVEEAKHHGLSDYSDEGPQVFDTMSGGSFSR